MILGGFIMRLARPLHRSLELRAATTIALGATLVLTFASAACAQARGVADIAKYAGADRQAMLAAGAIKEGGVTIYTIGTQIQPLVDRFHKKYPGVKITVSRQSAAETTRKVMEEYQAGAYYVDVFEQPTAGMIVPRTLGFLQPYATPEATNYSAAAIEKDGRWISIREGYIGLGFTTKKMASADAPKTYRDLLNPKYKDIMALSGAISTASGWVGAMVLAEGEDFVRKLGEQNIRVYAMSGRAIANMMISGEVTLSPTIYSSHVEASRKVDAPLEWRALGPVPVTDTSVALAAKAPHPHAAMLYIDFMLSKEAQLQLHDLGYLSARNDMPSDEYPGLQKAYLANRPTYLEDFDTWSRLYEQVFLKGAKAPVVQE
jgi:iron(III) transport system substrate-binding protein